MAASGFNPYECRTKEQIRAGKAFERLIADQPRADAAYDALRETRGGAIVSTDFVRLLDVKYAQPPPGGFCDLAPSWNKASCYARDRFFRELLNRGKRRRVMFTAGGWGAGKTYTLENAGLEWDLTWDGTLADDEWASEMIEAAVFNGWEVIVAYVFRNIEFAVYGALERAKTERRMVPMTGLYKSHRTAQESIVKLLRLYTKHPLISFRLFYNAGNRQFPRCAPELNFTDLAPEGALHYTARHESFYNKIAEEIWSGCEKSNYF